MHVGVNRERVRGGDCLGWATGTIVRDLVAEGIIESVNWAGLPHSVGESLRRNQQRLRQECPDHVVRELIARRDSARLEIIKNQLLQPVLRHHAATALGAPNSLTNWAGTAPLAEAPFCRRARSLASSRSWQRLCCRVSLVRPPGTGLSADIVHRQKEVQDGIEAPLITQLTAGDGRFSGPQGFLPYFEALMPHADAYRPINEQILRDWVARRDRLYRLRDVAEVHLWPKLHEEWLPALTSGAMTSAAFERCIDRAVSMGPFLRFLDSAPSRPSSEPCRPAIAATVGAGAGALAVKAGLSPLEATVAGAAAVAVEEGVRRHTAPLTSNMQAEKTLAVFYQQGKKAIA